MKHSLLIFFSTAAATLVAVGGELPRVWMSTSFMKDLDVFEKAVKDCRAHGIDVMNNGAAPDAKLCAERLSICRAHGMKLHVGVSDASKTDKLAKDTGRYELAVMSGGCYKGLAIDRNLFSFTAAKHEVIVEPPVYSKGQAYAKHPHYYMLGDGHYFGGYVPTGRAEVVVPERPFDGKQHLRIVPAKVEFAPPGAVPENDSAAAILDTREIKERRLVKLSFDLTGCDGCMLDKVGLAVYWHMDAKVPKWKPERTCYSVFSPITRERMRENVRGALAPWAEANGGKFPDDVVVGLRIGDEIFNATGWLNCPAASFPLWDYSDSAIAAFRAASPKGVEHPRTWGAPEVYGPDACAQFLYLFHKACAEYVKAAVEEAHKASPQIVTFRNTTRGGAWAYANDHDGTGQELLVAALDAVNLDPYPVGRSGYANDSIPFDMAYLSGLTRRYGKHLLPWMQAHEFPACGLVHPKPEDIERMWRQMKPFAPDAIMWLGYNAVGKNMMTFPNGNPASWEKAKEVHAEMQAMPKPVRHRPPLAIVRPYSARAIVCETKNGFVNPADVVLSQFAKAWSCDLGREYDVFEVPPYESDEAKAKRSAELGQYAHVVSSVDWPGTVNIAQGYEDKTLTHKDLKRLREEFRRRYEKTPGSPEAKVRPMPDRNLLERMRSGVDVIGIVHFTVNTFTDREWGYGSESPDDFNPTDFDADQIVKACRDGGIKGLIVVAKHHDGFCLWPTKTTEHNISKSRWMDGKGDYVGAMEKACRKFGVKFGVYCSPWDRNNAAYATPEYVKTFHAQVEELNDGRYGEIFEMWFDGANGGDGYYGGAWEKRSIGVARKYYKMAELLARVRELQPQVCFFGGDKGFTWPGNERGEVPPESGGTRDDGTFRIYEADFPLRPGWFYHESQDGYSRSGEFLMKIYLRTVGNGATMDIGIAPDRRGRLTDEDVGCLKRFSEIREEFFSKPVADATSPFNVIVMTEDIEHGECVDKWRVLLDGRELAKGGKIGTKRIRVLDAPVSGKELKLDVVKGEAKADEIKIELFAADVELVCKVMASQEPKRPPAPFELKGVLTSRKNNELVYMMKHPRTVSSIVLSPDAESLDGAPVAFRLSYSDDGSKWTEDAAEYRLDNVAANPVPQKVALAKSVRVKYLRLKPVRTLKDGAAVHLSGLEFVP